MLHRSSGRVDSDPALPAIAFRPTRQRTSRGRLRGLDSLIGQPLLPTHFDGNEVWVEFGFGSSLATVDDLRCTLNSNQLNCPIVALDQQLDEHLLTESASLRVRLSGFNLALKPNEEVRVLRCMNVLRQYTEAEALEAHQYLGACLVNNGLLLEGNCSKDGAVLCCHLLRRHSDALQRTALLFHTDFSQGFAPVMFRDRLPRDLRRHAHRRGILGALFERWTSCWHTVRAPQSSPADSFKETALLLDKQQPGEWEISYTHLGTLIWTPKGGVPCAQDGSEPQF